MAKSNHQVDIRNRQPSVRQSSPIQKMSLTMRMSENIDDTIVFIFVYFFFIMFHAAGFRPYHANIIGKFFCDDCKWRC